MPNSWDELTKPADTLEENVRRFFTILDTKEVSEMSDEEFHPTKLEVYIGSCRVLDCEKLKRLLEEMKKQSNYVKGGYHGY